MKLASLTLRFLQLSLSLIILALSIHLSGLYSIHYYPKHGMPSSARYAGWTGGYGVLIAGIGVVLIIVGRAHAVLMMCLDVLAGVFWLVAGFALVPLHASFNGAGHWVCAIDDSPKVCRRIKREARADTAVAFLAFLVTLGLLATAMVERRRVHRRPPAAPP